MKIIVATNNKGKAKEIKAILKEYEIVTLEEAGINLDIEETGETFLENAKIKAREVAKYTDEIVLADDTGLSIKCLDGFPGVKTHRFLGENATDEERNNYIIEQLKGKQGDERAAEVVTCIAVIKDKEEYTVIGVNEGRIADKPRGKSGFGFDPIFETSFGKTLAEIPPYQKNRASSRKIALTKLKKLNIL